MAEWRRERTRCPLEGVAEFDRCSPCRFFRGATLVESKLWDVCCNHPRDGNYVAPEREPVPDVFRDAFGEGAA